MTTSSTRPRSDVEKYLDLWAESVWRDLTGRPDEACEDYILFRMEDLAQETDAETFDWIDAAGAELNSYFTKLCGEALDSAHPPELARRVVLAAEQDPARLRQVLSTTTEPDYGFMQLPEISLPAELLGECYAVRLQPRFRQLLSCDTLLDPHGSGSPQTDGPARADRPSVWGDPGSLRGPHGPTMVS